MSHHSGKTSDEGDTAFLSRCFPPEYASEAEVCVKAVATCGQLVHRRKHLLEATRLRNLQNAAVPSLKSHLPLIFFFQFKLGDGLRNEIHSAYASAMLLLKRNFQNADRAIVGTIVEDSPSASLLFLT